MLISLYLLSRFYSIRIIKNQILTVTGPNPDIFSNSRVEGLKLTSLMSAWRV